MKDPEFPSQRRNTSLSRNGMSSDERAEIAIRRARLEISTLEEVEDAIEKSSQMKALHAYTKSANKKLQMQNEIARLKLEAERKAGKMLKDMDMVGGDRRSESRSTGSTLERLGISKHQSARWQYLASIEDIDFDSYCQQQVLEGREITQSGLVRLQRKRVRHEQPRGLKCPRCGLRDDPVERTHAVVSVIRRRDRRCTHCDLKYVTWEMVIDPENPPPISVHSVPRGDEPPSTQESTTN